MDVFRAESGTLGHDCRPRLALLAQASQAVCNMPTVDWVLLGSGRFNHGEDPRPGIPVAFTCSMFGDASCLSAGESSKSSGIQLCQRSTHRHGSFGLKVGNLPAVMQGRQPFLGILWDVFKGAEYHKANAGLRMRTPSRDQ